MNFNEKSSKISSIIYRIEEKIDFFTHRTFISLLIIGMISLLIRLLIFDSEIPIRQDANAYFWYAMDMSILNYFPYSAHANDGWPMVLSVVFSIFNFNNYLDYTIIQRLTTVIISVLTIIPVYYFCRKFFQPMYSLVGVTLIAFEPHLIHNSLLGLTEPLYIFLGISSLSLFLSKNKKLMYCSFAVVGLATIVRAEGIILLGIISILFFIFTKRDKKIIGKFSIAIVIFIIIFGLMTLIKIDTNEGLEGTAANTIGIWASNSVINEEGEVLGGNISKGVETLIKRLAQSMIPYFALFVPFGIILIFNEKNKNKFLILITLLIYFIASVRMFTMVYDLRLILILYPLFAILSVYTIQYLIQKIELKKIFLILIIGGCLVLSIYHLYLEEDSDYEKEVIIFAEYVIKNIRVSNNFYPESGYIYAVWANSNLELPILSSSAEYKGPKLLDYIENSFDYIEYNAKSVEEYILLSREQKLSHLVIDDSEKRPSYFNNVFYNEEKYPYLIKEFDSRDYGYKFYNVKVFKIDYNIFNEFIK